MTKKMFLLAALAGTLTGSLSSLNADTLRTEKVNIPFGFHVSTTNLPPGEYRVSQNFGTDIATLVNARTGQRVQFIRPSTNRKQGKAVLTFVQDKNGYALRVS